VHLPSLDKLKIIVEKDGIEGLIDKYSCYDFLVGTTESIEYFQEIYNKFKEEKL
jgi:hypothetical protein